MAKLLMLKEYLELDDDGFVLGVGVTTIRRLLDAELRRESAMSKSARGSAAANGNALGKFAAAIKVRCLPSSSRPERATFSAFSWKKKKDNKTKQRLTEDQNPFASVGWQALRLPSPVISSRPSNCSYAASPAPYCLRVTSTTTGEERKEHSPPLSSPSQPSRNEEATSITATLSPATDFDGREGEEVAENKSNDEDEKVRVSLVSMIDYTNKKDRVDDEEDEEESFYRSLDNIERATEQLLHRIRRFEMLAELDLPMERCSPSSDGDDDVSRHAEEEEEEEERAWELLGRLKANAPRGGGEKLLLDFFVQGGEADGGGLLPMGQRRRQGATATTTTTEMLRTARRWIDGPPGAEAEEDCCHGEVATLREMERDGRWRCFHEEEDELALRFGDAMLQLLVEELVTELASQL